MTSWIGSEIGMMGEGMSSGFEESYKALTYWHSHDHTAEILAPAMQSKALSHTSVSARLSPQTHVVVAKAHAQGFHRLFGLEMN